MEPINFQPTSILTTFKAKCSIITCFHEKYCIKAEIEAAVVATLEEIISAHKIKSHCTDWTDDLDVDDLYNSDDDQCGCNSAFGTDNDVEVLHYVLKCKYQF